MKKTFLIVIFTAFIFTNKLFSQASFTSSNKWGLETELIQPWIPEVKIFRIQATRSFSNSNNNFRGDLLFGAYIRPNVEHSIVNKINEYLLIIGYRQYL